MPVAVRLAQGMWGIMVPIIGTHLGLDYGRKLPSDNKVTMLRHAFFRASASRCKHSARAEQ